MYAFAHCDGSIVTQIIMVSTYIFLNFRWDYAFYASGFFISIAGGFVYITALLQDRDERELAKTNKHDNSDIC